MPFPQAPPSAQRVGQPLSCDTGEAARLPTLSARLAGQARAGWWDWHYLTRSLTCAGKKDISVRQCLCRYVFVAWRRLAASSPRSAAIHRLSRLLAGCMTTLLAGARGGLLGGSLILDYGVSRSTSLSRHKQGKESHAERLPGVRYRE